MSGPEPSWGPAVGEPVVAPVTPGSPLGPMHTPAPFGAAVPNATHRLPGEAARAGRDGWRRLHPLSPLVRTGRSLGGLLVLLALAGRAGGGDLGAEAVLVGVAVVLGVVSWLVTRWRVELDVLRIDTGLLRRSSRRFPLSQIQAVDTVEPLLARILGLAELRVRVGGPSGSAGRLAYLHVDEARALRGELLALAARASAAGQGTSRPEPAKHPVVTVDNRRLVSAVLLSGPGLGVVACALVLLAVTVLHRTAGAAVGSAGAAALLAFGTLAWRQINSGWGLRVVEGDGGYHVDSGLLATAAETIPFGRVQAVRVVEPLLWRRLGWCRVEVGVAGRQRGGHEDEAEGRAVRSLLPVGSRAQAEALLDRLLPGPPPARLRPPPRARWKSPLRYPKLSFGADQHHAVTTTGRLRRETAWVPFAKVQGIRLVEGPLQRVLGLATIHLDTAGPSVHAAARDRDRRECAALMSVLPARCRAARAGGEPSA
jgi:putative membrane protein